VSCASAVTTALRPQSVQQSRSLLGGMRKRRSNPKSKFVYRHCTQLLAVCPPQMAKANIFTRSSLANKQTNKFWSPRILRQKCHIKKKVWFNLCEANNIPEAVLVLFKFVYLKKEKEKKENSLHTAVNFALAYFSNTGINMNY